MNNLTANTSRDWVGTKSTSLLAWWIPLAAMLCSMFVPVSLRTPVWVIALGWMGTACMLNARRCNRTHCRYTGPFYIAMIVPAIALGTGFVVVGMLGWISFAAFMAGGSVLIWWATERTWGKFS
jgi:hypothetical protein